MYNLKGMKKVKSFNELKRIAWEIYRWYELNVHLLNQEEHKRRYDICVSILVEYFSQVSGHTDVEKLKYGFSLLAYAENQSEKEKFEFNDKYRDIFENNKYYKEHLSRMKNRKI